MATTRCFNLDFAERRKLKFGVEKESVPVGDQVQSVLLIRIKTPASKKRIIRPRKQKAATTTSHTWPISGRLLHVAPLLPAGPIQHLTQAVAVSSGDFHSYPL